MTALERAFERWRTDGLNVVTLAERIEGDKGTASASAKVREGTILDALSALARAERALGAEKHEEAIEAYDECLSKCVKGWMNGRAEYSALVAMACGMSEGDASAARGECRVAPYRAVAGTALSGRAVASSRAGAWSDALRDAEAALDSAPDISITHERAGLILQRAGADTASEYDQFASKIAGKRTSNLRRSNTFDGDSTDELYDAGERSHESALKCIDAEEWIRARQSMLHGAGVLFAKRDNERIYRDRVSFLERAKSIYVAKAADLPEETVQTTWLDNAFVLAGFDNLSDAEKSNVCLTIGNIFTWVGNFAGASELYSCGINVVMTADDAGSFDDLEQTLKSNRVLSQLRDRQHVKAWKNVRKFMVEPNREKFAVGFLRLAEVALTRKEWGTAEQSFRIAEKLDPAMRVRHKVKASRRMELENKQPIVDVEQLEELDKIQVGEAMEFSETPRFTATSKQNSLTDKSNPEQVSQAAQEMVDELQERLSSPELADGEDSQSKIFSGLGTRSLRIEEIMRDLDGEASPKRPKRSKMRLETCSCTEVFSFLNWRSIDASSRKSSEEEEIFLAALLDPVPVSEQADDMDVDVDIEARTPAPIDDEKSTRRRR